MNDIRTVERRIYQLPSIVNKIDDFGYSPLHFAAQSNSFQVVKLLLEHGAKADGPSSSSPSSFYVARCTPLHRAAFAGAYESCQLLLAHGASVNALDSSFGDLRTPLLKAASRNHERIVALLIDSGADVAVKDSRGLQLDQVWGSEISMMSVAALGKEHVLTEENSGFTICSEINNAVCAGDEAKALCSICQSPSLAFSRKGGKLICFDCKYR